MNAIQELSGVENDIHIGKKLLPKGERTPIEKFNAPILRALIQMNGNARVRDVQRFVYEHMAGTLNQADLYNFGTYSGDYRWVKTMHFARLTMVKEGLLAADSPRGYWHITKKGREYLDDNK